MTADPDTPRRPPLELPRVIGHRGAAALAPENTLPGFHAAAEAGARWVEFDVRLTADGELVLIHDETLERTTDGHGAVAALTAAGRRRLDAGSWLDPRWTGTPVPVLDEALALAAQLALGVNIEVKPAPAVTDATVDATIASVRRCWPASSPPALVSSLDRAVLAAFHARAPELPRAIVLEELDLDGLDALDLASIHVWEIRLDKTAVAAIRQQFPGARLASFTVNSPQRAAQLHALGVDAVFSDDPARLLRVPAR